MGAAVPNYEDFSILYNFWDEKAGLLLLIHSLKLFKKVFVFQEA